MYVRMPCRHANILFGCQKVWISLAGQFLQSCTTISINDAPHRLKILWHNLEKICSAMKMDLLTPESYAKRKRILKVWFSKILILVHFYYCLLPRQQKLSSAIRKILFCKNSSTVKIIYYSAPPVLQPALRSARGTVSRIRNSYRA